MSYSLGCAQSDLSLVWSCQSGYNKCVQVFATCGATLTEDVC